MTTSRFLRGAVVALIIVALSDFFWHGWILMDFYAQKVGAMGGALPAGLPLAAVLFYLIAAAGSSYFVQATLPKDWMGGLWRGAFLGLIIAGSINCIGNMLLPAWDWTLVMVDVAWGVITGAVVGAAIVVANKK